MTATRAPLKRLLRRKHLRAQLTTVYVAAFAVALIAHSVKGVWFAPAVIAMVAAGLAVAAVVATNPGGTR